MSRETKTCRGQETHINASENQNHHIPNSLLQAKIMQSEMTPSLEIQWHVKHLVYVIHGFLCEDSWLKQIRF